MFQGSIVALVTPMHPDGSIDYPAWRKLVRWHCQQGSDGLVVAGTTGESATLTADEFKELLRNAIDEANGAFPILAGTGTNDTKTTIARTRVAMESGAAAALVVTPYYNRPSQSGLEAHYRALAQAVKIPLVLYNVPDRTGVDLQPETVARLADIEQIVALKEANASPERLPALQQLLGERLFFLSGDDSTAADTTLAGGHGVISVAANAAPAAMAQLCQLARAGERQQAGMLNQRLKALYKLSIRGGSPTGIKWCLWQAQRIQRGIRLPLTWLDPGLEQGALTLYREIEDLVTR